MFNANNEIVYFIINNIYPPEIGSDQIIYHQICYVLFYIENATIRSKS